MHKSVSLVGLSVEATAWDGICQIFHLIFSVLLFSLTVVAAAVVVLLMAVVIVVVVVVVSSIKYILYVVCIRPHYTCRFRHVGQYCLHLI